MARARTRTRMTALVTVVLAVLFVAMVKEARADAILTPVAAASRLLFELSESREERVVARCVSQSALGESGGVLVFGMTTVRGDVLYLSTRYVCVPLARMSPLSPTISNVEIDAVKTVAHEWFHTRGVENERVTECYAVRLTWKWIQQGSSYTPRARAAARQHLLDNSHREAGYKLGPGCTLT